MAETEAETIQRLTAYYDNQKKVCDNLVPIEKSLGDIKAYVQSKTADDPMLNATVNTTYDAKKGGGGGCLVM